VDRVRLGFETEVCKAAVNPEIAAFPLLIFEWLRRIRRIHPCCRNQIVAAGASPSPEGTRRYHDNLVGSGTYRFLVALPAG
jgi:hypothetical protein